MHGWEGRTLGVTADEFRRGLRKWARRGSYVGLAAALAISSWAMLTEDPGDLRDFVALVLILPAYGALGGAMSFIKTATFAELRESVGVRRSLALMFGLFGGIVVASVLAKMIGGW
jgi:hypothetical protein